ncbi:MAG TPA: A/G-specific adenine glycosylase [Desulfuromonadales bacterium]|nr:A/G-specific adenine glycosylase [Desulfuromonadales bacterium]
MLAAFRRTILDRYRAHPRPMPWRETGDPYHILVSEAMLQQTQVERVWSKYEEFLTAFPTVEQLAAAPLAEVLRVWQGLGYNRRAVALQRCAVEVVGRFGGKLPLSVADLQSLPGIGPYTARAVAAFAYGVAEALIETNIRTVFIHCFFHGHDSVSDGEILPLVELTRDRKNPRDWYYALMDYGVHLKKTHPNPGRRSRHHTRQTAFEGSNRQLRSRLLRAVLQQPGVSIAELAEIVQKERKDVVENLDSMEREGFLEKRGGSYFIMGEKKQG